ncbi:MAG: DUF4920 domain-containing protein [Polyangiaceae bacterium]
MKRAIGASALLLVLGVIVGCEAPPPAPQKDAVQDGAASEPAKAAEPAGAVKEAKADDEVMDGCPGEEHEACGHDASTGEVADGHFGQPFSLTSREGLSSAATRLGAGETAKDGETVQVTGTVDAVCKKKGCWMVIKDGDVTARVFTHAGRFFMPVDVNRGRSAVVEGKLRARVMSEKFAKHLAEDKGEDPATVSGDTREWVIDATSAELL